MASAAGTKAIPLDARELAPCEALELAEALKSLTLPHQDRAEATSAKAGATEEE